MNEDVFPENMHEHGIGHLKVYSYAFVLSIILTLLAYFITIYDLLGPISLVAVLLVLGAIQVFLQLYFFLHLGKEEKPDWSVLIFSSGGIILLIVVSGTLWIMNNLGNRVMTDM